MNRKRPVFCRGDTPFSGWGYCIFAPPAYFPGRLIAICEAAKSWAIRDSGGFPTYSGTDKHGRESVWRKGISWTRERRRFETADQVDKEMAESWGFIWGCSRISSSIVMAGSIRNDEIWPAIWILS